MSPRRIFILTGAGFSAKSGLSTFRDKDGIWARYSLEEVASVEGYRRDPAKVLDFYNLRRASLAGVQPNAAHHALAAIETAWDARGGEVTLCTQNVDDLHERAGSRRLIHMHGELNKTRCDDCETVTLADGDLSVLLGCEACGHIGGLRPHVVWFGEMPLDMERIGEALVTADLFVSIGTSGAVYPAAGFVRIARAVGARTLELNLEPSEGSRFFDESRHGAASQLVPVWVNEMLARVG